MQWEGRRESDNVEDRRGMGAQGIAIGGGATIIVMIIALLLGKDPRQLMQQVNQVIPQQEVQGPGNGDPEEEKRVRFVKVVLADTEDVWTALFRKMGKQYQQPKLVLFRGQVQSACGFADAAVGPFYCPGDQKVYLDLSFFKELATRFKAPGDFAQAYVIAHEVGHHVQNLTGDSAKVDRARGTKLENQMSVRLELQADFYAGVFAHHAQKTKNILQPGDIESALKAAFAIGDDTLQKQSRGRVVPDSFTHGTSEQRIRWFKRGFQTGDPAVGQETFQLNYNDL